MFNKLLSETYLKVCTKAEKVRESVILHASKAREALGLNESNQTSADELVESLKRQIEPMTSISQVHSTLICWIAHLITSGSSGSSKFFKFQLPLVTSDKSTILDTQKTSSLNNQPTLIQVGDVCSSFSWTSLSQPNKNKKKIPLSDSWGTENDNLLMTAITKIADYEQGLSFRQVFLRSNVLEFTLLHLARQGQLRTKFVMPSEQLTEEEISTHGALYRLLALTLMGDARQHRELLFLLCSLDLTNSVRLPAQFCQLAELVTILKQDWLMDYLYAQKQQLQEKLKIMQHDDTMAVPKKPTSSINDNERQEQHLFNANMMASLKQQRETVLVLLELQAISNLIERRQKIIALHRKRRLDNLLLSTETIYSKFIDLELSAQDQSQTLKAEYNSVTQSLDERLNSKKNELVVLHVAIAEQEKKKEKILAELENVNIILKDMYKKINEINDFIESVNLRKDTLPQSLKNKVAAAEELKHQSSLHKLDVENVKSFVKTISTYFKQFEEFDTEPMQYNQVIFSSLTDYAQLHLKAMKKIQKQLENEMASFEKACSLLSSETQNGTPTTLLPSMPVERAISNISNASIPAEETNTHDAEGAVSQFKSGESLSDTNNKGGDNNDSSEQTVGQNPGFCIGNGSVLSELEKQRRIHRHKCSEIVLQYSQIWENWVKFLSHNLIPMLPASPIEWLPTTVVSFEGNNSLSQIILPVGIKLPTLEKELLYIIEETYSVHMEFQNFVSKHSEIFHQ